MSNQRESSPVDSRPAPAQSCCSVSADASPISLTVSIGDKLISRIPRTGKPNSSGQLRSRAWGGNDLSGGFLSGHIVELNIEKFRASDGDAVWALVLDI